MADAFGNLLFYTDGVRLWNKNHQLMVNGSGLMGNPDVTQSVVIVPKPLSRHRYYIFTVDSRNGNTPNALRYSEVDMSLQGGLGEVVKKNVLLLEDVSEKVTATLHSNNQDFWLLAHTWGTSTFYAYRIDSTGVSSSAVKSDVGSLYTGTLASGRGSFRLSNSYYSNKVVVALPDLRVFDILSFFNDSGRMVGYGDLSSMSEKAAYAEFAGWPSSSLYTISTKGDEIFEFYLNGQSEEAIASTSRTVAKGAGFGEVRLAPNGLLYVAATNTISLHTIDNSSHTSYNQPAVFKENAVSLAPNSSLEGLPNTIANYSAKMEGISLASFESLCLGEPITFLPYFPNSVDSVSWNFDDPASGALNYSNEVQPTHVFRTPGKTFNVKATIYARGTVLEVLENSGILNMGYTFDLGKDTALCFTPNQKLLLQPKVSDVKAFKWQDGSTAPSYTVTKPGVYWLEITSANWGCVYRDSIEVRVLPKLEVSLGNDTTLCTGATLLLRATNPDAQYWWQDGSSSPEYLVSAPGLYEVQVTNSAGCSASDLIRVHYLTPPAIQLGNDTTICEWSELTLDATLPGVTYNWQDGSTGPTFRVTKPGTYWVDASIDVCTARDSIVIKTRQGCLGDLFAPNIITPNGDGLNDAFVVLDPEKNNVWQLEIFNRYGKQVFKTSNYDNSWDASGLSAGVYYYLITDNKGRRLKGSVEVIR